MLVDGIGLYPLDYESIIAIALGVIAVAVAVWSHHRVTSRLKEIARGEINEKLAMVHGYAADTYLPNDKSAEALIVRMERFHQKILSDLKSMESINAQWTDTAEDEKLKERLTDGEKALKENMRKLGWETTEVTRVFDKVLGRKPQSD